MATYYWVGGNGTWDGASTANWSATTGGAAGAGPPLAADSVVFDASSGTGTCTTAAGAVCTNVTFNSATLGLTLGANLSPGGTFTLTLGTVTLQSFTLSCNFFSSSNSNARTVAFGTGAIEVRGNGATVWSTGTATNFVVSGSRTVNFTYSGATGTRTISTGASNPNSIDINITAGADTINNLGHVRNLNFSGFSGTWSHNTPSTHFGDITFSSTMSNSGTAIINILPTSGNVLFTSAGLTLDLPIAMGGASSSPVVKCQDALTLGPTRAFTLSGGTLQLKNGVTSTVGSMVVNSPRPRTLKSLVDGSQATLSQASGTVSAAQLTIQDINATGGATWLAYYENRNIDAGNNTGWNFGGSPTVVSETPYRLRTFTSFGRF